MDDEIIRFNNSIKMFIFLNYWYENSYSIEIINYHKNIICVFNISKHKVMFLSFFEVIKMIIHKNNSFFYFNEMAK